MVEADGTVEVTTTTTTSLAPVLLTTGGGREVLRMLRGHLIVQVVTMEEGDGTTEEEDGTMEEDGTTGGTGTVEGLDLATTLATTLDMVEGGVSGTASVLALSSVVICTLATSAHSPSIMAETSIINYELYFQKNSRDLNLKSPGMPRITLCMKMNTFSDT